MGDVIRHAVQPPKQSASSCQIIFTIPERFEGCADDRGASSEWRLRFTIRGSETWALILRVVGRQDTSFKIRPQVKYQGVQKFTSN